MTSSINFPLPAMKRLLHSTQRLANRAEVCITTTTAAHRVCQLLTLTENRLWRLASELLPSSKFVANRAITTGIEVLEWEEIIQG